MPVGTEGASLGKATAGPAAAQGASSRGADQRLRPGSADPGTTAASRRKAIALPCAVLAWTPGPARGRTREIATSTVCHRPPLRMCATAMTRAPGTGRRRLS